MTLIPNEESAETVEGLGDGAFARREAKAQIRLAAWAEGRTRCERHGGLAQYLSGERRGVGDTSNGEEREEAAARNGEAYALDARQRVDDLRSPGREVRSQLGGVSVALSQRDDPSLLHGGRGIGCHELHAGRHRLNHL